MEKKGIIALAIIGILAAAFFTWTVVGVFFGEQIKEETDEDVTDVYISGSTTCFPAILACAEEFEEEEDDTYDIHVTGGGSSKGISDVINNLVDLGMASRPLKSTESSVSGMTQLAFANDGIALIMKAGNEHFSGTVPQWTIEDVLKIWNGTYDTWDDVPGCSSGPDDAIILIGRDSNSGTRSSFEELTGLIDDPAYETITKQELNSNGAVHDAVATDDDAIGYVGLGFIDAAVEGIDLGTDGITFYEPNADNVRSGNYHISRKLYLIYKNEIPEDAEDFVDFVLSSDGQAIVESEGFVRL